MMLSVPPCYVRLDRSAAFFLFFTVQALGQPTLRLSLNTSTYITHGCKN
jgi:hypothetical protein